MKLLVKTVVSYRVHCAVMAGIYWLTALQKFGVGKVLLLFLDEVMLNKAAFTAFDL